MNTQDSQNAQKVYVARFSLLTGELRRLVDPTGYKVKFIKLSQGDNSFYRLWTRFLAYGATLLAVTFAVIIFLPSNWVVNISPDAPTLFESWIMLVSLAILQLLVIFGTLAATRSTLRVRNPVPVTVPNGLRVALATTRAPGESLAMVEKTLTAAKLVQYREGTVDVWLLDETNDRGLRQVCNKLEVRYFSRAPVKKWNQVLGVKSSRGKTKRGSNPFDPHFEAKTKHGNFNAWRAYLKKRHIDYDILAGVDTDQVPQPNLLLRLLGYFNDEDVAFVVGPQVYGNYQSGIGGLVSRWAESQASFFQSTIQRAGNASSSAMFVGTNYAVRMKVLDQIGGFQPFVTEDMATGLAIHTSRNEVTGRRWKSVYTPDVLAIGEGPRLWGSYFSQQWRWAAGTFDIWRRLVWRVAFKLPPRAFMHYAFILSFYPIAAVTWILASLSCLIYLLSGATAVIAPWGEFASLYMMTIIMQLSLYFWNRRYNVSPHEPLGSFGVAGMALTSLAAPIYVAALIGVIFGKRATFVVTAKGESGSSDGLRTFRTQLTWMVVLLIATSYALGIGHSNPAMLIWVGILFVICLFPIVHHGVQSAQFSRLPQLSLSAAQLIKETPNV